MSKAEIHTLTEAQFCDFIKAVEDGCDMPLLITGTSMSPYLRDRRDSIIVSRTAKPLKRGDMAFFRRASGGFVMHRICKIDGDDFYFIGDGQSGVEGPVKRGQIFGVINTVIRNGKAQSGGAAWRFYRHIWIRLIPLRPFLFRINSLRHKRHK